MSVMSPHIPVSQDSSSLAAGIPLEITWPPLTGGASLSGGHRRRHELQICSGCRNGHSVVIVVGMPGANLGSLYRI